MDKSSQHEVAGRAQKAMALAAAIMVDAVAHGEDVLSPAFVEKLEAAGQDFWKLAAEKAGRPMPSLLTQQAVIAFFRGAASRVVVPTQAGAEA